MSEELIGMELDHFTMLDGSASDFDTWTEAFGMSNREVCTAVAEYLGEIPTETDDDIVNGTFQGGFHVFLPIFSTAKSKIQRNHIILMRDYCWEKKSSMSGSPKIW